MNFKCNLDDVHINNSVLNKSTEVKFLGLHIDDRLKFDTHIASLNKKLASQCYAIGVISRELDMGIARMSYFALVESHLRYGLCFWGTCSGFLFNSVFVLQKRAIRFLCRIRPRDSCKPFFISERILTLPCLFILESVCLIHKKYRNNLEPIHTYNTRNRLNLRLPIPVTTQLKNSIIFNSRKLFNHLPTDFKSITNIRLFKQRVKSLLIARAYYNVNDYFDERF